MRQMYLGINQSCYNCSRVQLISYSNTSRQLLTATRLQIKQDMPNLMMLYPDPVVSFGYELFMDLQQFM
jgi:hypothetical protein